MASLLTPDVEFDPSAGARLAALSGSLTENSLPAGNRQVRMLLKEVHVLKKGEFLGKAEVQVVTIVSDGVSAEPIKVETAIFTKVKKNDKLSLPVPGLVLYTSPQAAQPNYLRYDILVIEIDEAGRKRGEWLQKIVNDDKFTSTAQAILKAASITNPTIELITGGAKLALNLVAQLMQKNKDDKLFLLSGAYDSRFDDLGVKYGEVRRGNRFVEIVCEVQAA